MGIFFIIQKWGFLRFTEGHFYAKFLIVKFSKVFF